MYRFLLTRRWVGAFAFALVFAVACVLLGTWQLDRYEARSARNALITDNYDREPVASLTALLDDGTELATADTWTPVRLEGRYAPDGSVLLRNRPLDGSPGYHVLVPFETTGDASPSVLLVDRGWLPTGADGDVPDVVPAPPSGPVQVVVRLRPAEAAGDREAPAGQTYRIAPAALGDELTPPPTQTTPATQTTQPTPAVRVVTGAYGELGLETPAPAQAPTPLPRPEVDDGPHLGYALQWVVFALVALVGFVVVVRRTAHELDDWPAADDAAPPRPARPPGRPGRRRRGRSDEEVEDAELDAADRR